MKFLNPILITSAIAATALFSSCTKDYTCQCTIHFSGGPGLPDSVVSQYPVRDTKAKAKSICEGNSASYQTGNVKTTETCTVR